MLLDTLIQIPHESNPQAFKILLPLGLLLLFAKVFALLLSKIKVPHCGLSSRFDLFDPRAEYLDRLHSHQWSLFLLKSRCHPHHVLRRY